MNRRELLKGLAAGGIIVAGELWIPGQKLISIPKPCSFGPGPYLKFYDSFNNVLAEGKAVFGPAKNGVASARPISMSVKMDGTIARSELCTKEYVIATDTTLNSYVVHTSDDIHIHSLFLSYPL